MEGYKPRYTGARWSIVYGSYQGIERFALQDLHRAVQRYHPYVVQVSPALGYALPDAGHLLLVGTPESNPLIRELIQGGYISLPNRPQAYTIACMDSPQRAGCRLLVIAGSDPPSRSGVT